MCQIEACLNSRPLTAMFSDPNYLTPLTPTHFLLGALIMQHPDTILTYEEPNGMRMDICSILTSDILGKMAKRVSATITDSWKVGLCIYQPSYRRYSCGQRG